MAETVQMYSSSQPSSIYLVHKSSEPRNFNHTANSRSFYLRVGKDEQQYSYDCQYSPRLHIFYCKPPTNFRHHTASASKNHGLALSNSCSGDIMCVASRYPSPRINTSHIVRDVRTKALLVKWFGIIIRIYPPIRKSVNRGSEYGNISKATDRHARLTCCNAISIVVANCTKYWVLDDDGSDAVSMNIFFSVGASSCFSCL